MGISKSGRAKPQKHTQVTPAFYYDLSSRQHTQTFLQSFHFCGAVAADPDLWRPFSKLGSCSELIGETKLSEGLECLKLGFPAARWRERVELTKHRPNTELQFSLRRVCYSKGRSAPAGFLNKTTFFEFPLSITQQVFDACIRLLRFYSTYASRHPEQFTSSETPWGSRKLCLNEEVYQDLLSDLEKLLKVKKDEVLWEDPQIYVESKFSRARNPKRESKKKLSLTELHPTYLKKLAGLERGMCWRESWPVSEWQAKKDLRNLHQDLPLIAMKLWFAFLVSCCGMIRLRSLAKQQTKIAFLVWSFSLKKRTSGVEVEETARGPPTKQSRELVKMGNFCLLLRDDCVVVYLETLFLPLRLSLPTTALPKRMGIRPKTKMVPKPFWLVKVNDLGYNRLKKIESEKCKGEDGVRGYSKIRVR